MEEKIERYAIPYINNADCISPDIYFTFASSSEQAFLNALHHLRDKDRQIAEREGDDFLPKPIIIEGLPEHIDIPEYLNIHGNDDADGSWIIHFNPTQI